MYYYSTSKKESHLKKKLLFLSLFSVIPFLAIVFVTLSGWEALTKIDYQFSHYIYNWHHVTLTNVMTLITQAGDLITQTLVSLVTVFSLFVLKKWRTALWYGFTVLGGALLLNGAVKEFYARARPSQIEPLVEIGGYSFPSGHSMGAMIVYGGILFLILRFIRGDLAKLSAKILIMLLIVLIGFSRIYLAVHFPSDVLGGFSLGLSWLSLSIAMFGIKYTQSDSRGRDRYSLKSL